MHRWVHDGPHLHTKRKDCSVRSTFPHVTFSPTLSPFPPPSPTVPLWSGISLLSSLHYHSDSLLGLRQAKRKGIIQTPQGQRRYIIKKQRKRLCKLSDLLVFILVSKQSVSLFNSRSCVCCLATWGYLFLVVKPSCQTLKLQNTYLFAFNCSTICTAASPFSF